MDAVLHWNDLALKALADDFSTIPFAPEQGGPTGSSRALAIVHLAMYDAFNTIAKKYSPYLEGLPDAPMGASEDAAIATAAYITLSNLYSKQSQDLFEEYESFMATLTGTGSLTAIENGRVQGQIVADAILEARKDDGSDKNIPYAPSQLPGKHRVDPLNPTQGFLGANWGEVETFGIPSGAAFVATPPPALTDTQYTTDYNDVKGKGASINSTRTVGETVIGIYWGYDGTPKLGTPPRLYNQIVREIAIKMSNTLGQNARLFALVNMAMADAGIQCWYSKYFYSLWRPVLGVREASLGWGPLGLGDGNLSTIGDPFWLPLGAPNTNRNQEGGKNFTPNFPAYPSGHATFGAASLDIVRLFYNNDNIPFDFVSDEFNGKNVDVDGSIRPFYKAHFNSLSQAILENGRSRVYLGVHWQFDADAGIESGKQIAQFIYDNCLQQLN
ncbi:vanadium-dependent haloperoxidase [Chroococcus sp. FPU101]|uniref:vanadium-dependent haloperoxidase n=1 Tax=Chroococcus sp. FPU101 TaxID=1974212 RepID=UPI001A8EE9A0|nr:vanadium-dependent haloperoxidase [Chroococcus sp. FPU101]GFE69662.1 similar to vanadium chloroperoxidase [Chroococcus sp. FPU101]